MKKSNEKIIDDVLKKIEADLEYIDINELIEFSGFSYFHFHRLFCAYVGESLKQYIKRIRLERSAYELNYNKRLSITEVALNAGFATPSAFNKAFKDFFKTTPSKYKKTNIKAKEFKMIKPIEIVDIKPIEIYTLRHIGDYNKVGVAFEKLMKWAYNKNLMKKNIYAYGIYYDDPNVTDIDKLRSDACISANDEVELDGDIAKKTIAGGKYAVFLHKGEYSNLKHTYNDIFSSYIKDNDIKLRDVPIFERYLDEDPKNTKPQDLKTEINIPIQ